jgi:hypothetical protein
MMTAMACLGGLPWAALVPAMACLGGFGGMTLAAFVGAHGLPMSVPRHTHGLPMWVSWHAHGHYKSRLVACQGLPWCVPGHGLP